MLCYFDLDVSQPLPSPLFIESIKPYLENDNMFNWNYGISLAAMGKFEEALEALLSVSDDVLKTELAYILWLSKCHIMTGALDKAWECLDIEDQEITYEALQLIANECYKLGGPAFIYSFRAFKELFEIDKFPDYLNGLIGASVGVFRHFIAQRQSSEILSIDQEALSEVIEVLETSTAPKCRGIAKTIQTWRMTHP